MSQYLKFITWSEKKPDVLQKLHQSDFHKCAVKNFLCSIWTLRVWNRCKTGVYSRNILNVTDGHLQVLQQRRNTGKGLRHGGTSKGERSSLAEKAEPSPLLPSALSSASRPCVSFRVQTHGPSWKTVVKKSLSVGGKEKPTNTRERAKGRWQWRMHHLQFSSNTLLVRSVIRWIFRYLGGKAQSRWLLALSK